MIGWLAAVTTGNLERPKSLKLSAFGRTGRTLGSFTFSLTLPSIIISRYTCVSGRDTLATQKNSVWWPSNSPELPVTAYIGYAHCPETDQEMASPNPPAPTAAGITVDAVTGERVIPSSVRADGTKRREIRIRPGYRPPEDVELYKNPSAEAWKNRGKAGVPGAEGLGSSDKAAEKSTSAVSNKNAKKREAKKRAKAATGDAVPSDNAANGDQSKQEGQQHKAEEEPLDPEAEKEKKARALRKKLRQARDLRDKKDKGESLLPEQLEKVIKIQELIRQLNALGFDADGEKKLAAEGKEQV
ncbi:hypothetical protein DTO027B5_5076 [Paecilomyces variotii]|nr:hypothetical protein DTO169C6_5561 [Paecilomyces variotii]KAJ9322605.1 hypothetical protein DTO027B3_6375 [Paecilomyces variotii]KAJ9333168.1 hypothetical protein DTO027B5_5076 [Paecilomyces variotii]